MIKQHFKDSEELVFIYCINEDMKLQLITEVVKKQPNLVQTTKKLCCGSDLGLNVSVNWVEQK